MAYGCSSEQPYGPVCVEPTEPGGHWERLPLPPVAAAPGSAYGLVTAWTGEELLVWGRPGASKEVEGQVVRPQGMAYSPATREWRDITPYGAGPVGDEPGAVWTGSEWVLWSGELSRAGDTLELSDRGVRIDPATGAWREISAAPIAGRFAPVGVWTGREVLFWGGYTQDFGVARDGAAYDPNTDSWRLLGSEGLVLPELLEVSPPAVWSGTHLLLWHSNESGAVVASMYDPDQDLWESFETDGAPRGVVGALWTGAEMLAWAYERGRGYVVGGGYDPVEARWRTLSTRGAIAGPRVWADDRMLTWGGDLDSGCRVGGAYDVATDTWTTFTSQGAPSARYGHTLTWTGHSLLVFGGKGGPEGRYDQWGGGEFFPDW